MNSPQRKYVVITPVRDEGEVLEATMQGIVKQTVLPTEWILVDDGSTDSTPAIINRYASEHPWIRAVHRTNRGFRKNGGGVMEAFYDGFNQIACQDWEFIVKLDGDLVAKQDYFQKCFEQFEQNERLGIGGGILYHFHDGTERLETAPKFHVRGATKIYRRKCWDEIGGLWPAPGWDTIDEVKAQMLGWTTYTFEDIRLLHQRPTGAVEGSWSDGIKSGLARYIAGYHPAFMFASCVSRIASKPYFTGALALWLGYLKGYVKHIPQINDPALIKFVRQQQVRRLLGKKTVMNYN
jgi:glycosyltransferase involved in cell wall biosynthesis